MKLLSIIAASVLCAGQDQSQKPQAAKDATEKTVDAYVSEIAFLKSRIKFLEMQINVITQTEWMRVALAVEDARAKLEKDSAPKK